MIERIVLPVLKDNHTHVSLYAALARCPDISALRALEARDFLASLPRDRLTVVRGWRSNMLPLSAEYLASLPPALIVNFSLHGYALTESALPIVREALPDIAGNRDDARWRESNVPRLFEAYCGLAGLEPALVDAFMESLARQGNGEADDMTVASSTSLDAMRASRYADRISYWASMTAWRSFDTERREACRGVKLFLDGSIGARTAAIAGSWKGGGEKLLVYGDEDLRLAVLEIAAVKTGLSMHAIGELAIDQALGALEAARRENADLSVARIEHAQFITMEQATRARDLGVTLSMQPNFTTDSRDYADRLDASALERNNPFRMLVDRAGFKPGRDLVFGSDGMPHGIEYALACALFPEYAGQALSVDELVAGYGAVEPLPGSPGNITFEVDQTARTVRRVHQD